MIVQLIPSNYEGNPIDVYCPDPNALCLYLYDYAQNQLQVYVQIGYAKPTGESGIVDPQWQLYPLIQEGTQFYVIVNQDANTTQTGNAEITLNIFVNDQQVASMQVNNQQSLYEILEYVNQNMQSQFNELELYDSTGVGISNNPMDSFGQFAQHATPFLLFIPLCQSGIQNFVEGVPQIPDISSQQQKTGAEFSGDAKQNKNLAANENVLGNVDSNGEITLNIFVYDKPCTTLQANIQQQLQEILAYVNENMQSQYTILELYDSNGNGMSNNPMDYIGQFAQAQGPFLLFIPGCTSGIENFVQGKPLIPDISTQQQKNTQVQIEVFQNDQKIAEFELEKTKTLQEILEFINQNTGMQLNVIELYDQESVGRSNEPMDKLEQFIQFPQPFKIIVKQTIHVEIYLNQVKCGELDANSNQNLQEILDYVNLSNQSQFQKIELFDQNGQKLSDNPQDLFEKFLNSQQPFNAHIPSKQILQTLPVVANQNLQQMESISNFNQSQINKNSQQTSNQINQLNSGQSPNLPSIDTQFFNMQIQDPAAIPYQPQQQRQESQQSPQMKTLSNQIVSNPLQLNPLPTQVFHPAKPIQQIVQPPVYSPPMPLQQQNVQPPPNFPPVQPPQKQNVQPPPNIPSVQPPQQQNVQPFPQPQQNVQPPVSPFGQPSLPQSNQPPVFNNIVNDDSDPFKTKKVEPQQLQQNPTNIQQQQANPFPNPQQKSFTMQPNIQNQNNFNLVPPPFNPLLAPQPQLPKPSQFPQSQFPQSQPQIPQQPTQQSNITNPNFVPVKPNIPSQVQQGNIPAFNNNQPKINQILSNEPNIKQQIQNVKDSLKVQKNFTLILDQSGEFVVYKFHFPIMISGSLTKANSKSQQKQNTNNLDWVKCNSTQFAEIDDYSFAIKWNNNNITVVKIKIE